MRTTTARTWTVLVGPALALATLLLATWVPLAAADDLAGEPQLAPTETAEPSPAPTLSPEPTASPSPTSSPEPTISPIPTEPTISPEPTVDDAPTEAVGDTTDTLDEATGTITDTLDDERDDEPTAPSDDPSDTDPGDAGTGDGGDAPTGPQDEPSGADPADGGTDDPAASGDRQAIVEHPRDGITPAVGGGASDQTDVDRAAPAGGAPSDRLQAVLTSVPRLPDLPILPFVASGPRSTGDIVDALVARGASEAEIIRVLAPFPVAGRANYSNDWHAPRYTPSFHLHQGVDVFAQRGTPVVAVADGRIDRISLGTAVGGNTVWLAADEGTHYFYAHLDSVRAGLDPGDPVTTGTVLGFVGNTGNARTTPPHLHFQVHPGGGDPVPPVPLLDGWLADARAELGLDGPTATAVVLGTPNGTPPVPALPQPLVAPELPRWEPAASGIGATTGASAGFEGRSGIGAATTQLAATAGATSDPGQLVSVGLLVLVVLLWFGRTRRPARRTSGFIDEDVLRRGAAASPNARRPPARS